CDERESENPRNDHMDRPPFCECAVASPIFQFCRAFQGTFCEATPIRVEFRRRRDSVMPPKVYIDGQAGTTALRIRDWLNGRKDLEIVTLPEALRKDPSVRKKALRDAAIVLLCLPDDASREA